MAWLQSSFTSHQLLGESTNNHKKGFKSGSGNKNSDPDKSDTPLLHDSTYSPERENTPSGWLKNSSNNVEKKQNLLSNSSKSSFLPHGLFDKSLSNSKGKLQTNQNASGTSTHTKKPSENMKLLSDDDKKKHPLFDAADDDEEEDNEEESEDEWCLPRLGGGGGYQKVRPCAE